MALNKSVFKTRALTALIFVAVMLVGLCLNAYSFFILISIIHFGAWWEYFNLLDKINATASHAFTKIGFSLMGYGFLLWATENVFQINELHLKNNFTIFVSAAGFLLTVVGIFKSSIITYKSFVWSFLGFLYITLSCALLIELSSMSYFKNSTITTWLPYGILLPSFIIACMWINDTMAYLVGSFIGKTPLSKISPKKTWEGTIGGIILCGVLVGFAMYTIDNHFYFNKTVGVWIILASFAAIIGTIGDLVESKIKRMAGVKDSGSFMPGHGGFLDRFDSLLFATPFMWLLFNLFIK
jgi:phosphatidate cytidylyltransferase